VYLPLIQSPIQFHMLSQLDSLGTVGVDKNATIKRTTNNNTEISIRIRKKLTFLNLAHFRVLMRKYKGISEKMI